MKDFNYKGSIPSIEELPEFHTSTIIETNKCKGTSTINDKN
jgi:hypothetical protein